MLRIIIAFAIALHSISAGAAPAPRTAVAVARGGSIDIDGRLDEAAWAEAPKVTGFWQRDPDEGAEPSQRTAFRVLYDERALYVGVRAFDTDPDAIRGLLTRRDEDSASDWIMVGIDSYRDRRTAFVFGLNPVGVQRDAILFDDIEEDYSWNAVWEGAAQIDEAGWVAEMRIPLSQLRFAEDAREGWGFQVARVVQREGEELMWSPAPRAESRVVSRFGRLRGVTDLESPRRIEIVPYVSSSAGYRARSDDAFSAGASAGLDVRYGLTSNLTLSATLNPDFGEVEADPSQVNLTDQELFLPEKRPFFVEGADMFRYGLGQGDGEGSVQQLFYTRRIGAAPSAIPDGAAAVPSTTTIFGAGKISGKTAGGTTVGAMAAVTGDESVDVVSPTGEMSSALAEPLTAYSVARLQKDLRDGQTVLGAIATSTNRRLGGTGIDALHDSAQSGGLELSHQFGGGAWHADLKVFGSTVGGSEAAIARTQQASQRYMQRPDAEHLDFDPTRTRLSGYGTMGSLMKMGGAHWRGGAGYDMRSPGFEANDLGFQLGADYLTSWVWGQYRDDTPGGWLRSFQINTNAWTVQNTALENLQSGGNVNANATMNNLWSLYAGVGANQNPLSTGLLRGGRAVAGEPNLFGWGGVASDARRRVTGSLSGEWSAQPTTRSWSTSIAASLGLQLASNLEIEVAPTARRRIDDRQYVGAYADGGDTRHIIARIDQRTLGMTLRGAYTITSNLSLQIYAQPLVATGRYADYRQPLEPRSADEAQRWQPARTEALGDFEPADFSIRELRSTSVLRWEYLPGSVLYLVWSHNRAGAGASPEPLVSAASGLADAPGEHRVLVKASYWWQPVGG